MPCGNGATVTKRKHGVCGPSFYFFSSLLVALCCLEPWSLGSQTATGRSCTPCPVNCSCSPAGPQQSCVVNCSNVGLDTAPGAADIPLFTTVLDLSKNHITSLDTTLLNRLPGLRELYLQSNRIVILPRGVFCYGPLTVLDLSNNQITKIEERICDDLCNLTQIDLSSNPFDCDCKLFHLVNWLQDKGVRVRRPDDMVCNHPPELRHKPLLNVRVLTCGLNYAACLEDSSSGGGGRSELVIFSSSTPGNFTREQCNSMCFAASHRYGGLGARQECLCSTNSEPNFISESQCSAACSNPSVMKECGWTLAHDVFAVDFSILLKALPLQSVHDRINFSAVSSVMPVALSWEFGDLSPRVNTTVTKVTSATHKYGLPGQYVVSLIAWAGHKEVTTRGEVSVAFPSKLELHCPPLTVVNGSLEVTLFSWGALGLDVDWKISKDDVQVAKASPHCPKDGVYHIESSCCFQIVPGEMSWTDARRQCLDRGGDLAIVRGDTLRNLLAHKVTQERGVWLGLSNVTSPGRLRWVNGSEAQNGEEGLQPRFSISRGNFCVSLDQRAQTSQHPCNTKRAFVCQYSPQVRVPDAGVYMVGLAVFPSHNSLLRVSVVPFSTAQTASTSIELMLFPALSFVQPGRLSSLELVMQERSSHVHVRFQVYRPQCHYAGLHLLLPSCHGPVCSPVAICVAEDTKDNNPRSCPRLQQWCPFQNRCLDLSSPCPPSSCPNCTYAFHLPPGARRPQYILQDEVAFTLPAGPAAHALVQEQLEDLLVFAGDIIGLQHDAGPASLLHCQSSPNSLWRQSVFVVNHSEWNLINTSRESAESSAGHGLDPQPHLVLESLMEAGGGGWLEEVVCPIRVLYVGHSEILLQGPKLSAGLSQPGLYTLQVSSAEPSYPASASCPLLVVPPLGLTILHPPLWNGSLYLQANSTRVLLHVQSRYSTRVSQRGTNHSVTFQPDCPSIFLSSPTLCKPRSHSGTEVTEPSLYAILDLSLVSKEQKDLIHVELHAYNNMTESSLAVVVHVEVPLKGLVVKPYPAQRVLMESVVSYTADVLEGSNPTYRWTVDDKPYFTYYNTVLNVIYQHAAVYKLTVTAMNHISSLTEHFNVTVDSLQPMTNLAVRGVPHVVPQGSTQTLTASVLVDMSVSATFRWSFGDGGYKEFEMKPPYAPSLFQPDSPHQVLLTNNITYIYSQPGIYSALVSVSNRYENISQSINMSVYSILTRVDIQTEPQFLLASKSAYFEAHPLPSPYGIHYDWNFGDDSAPCQGRRVAHTYTRSGAFNACVSVNNTISYNMACAEMFVFEEIEKMTAKSSSPSELHTPTIVKADTVSGNNITWIFSMGDGSNYTTSEPQVSHSYLKDGNYTVNVTAANAVSSGCILLTVQVYVFQVIRIEPSGCVQENRPINFDAWMSGNVSASLFEWSFGDGSPDEIHLGNPRVLHTYKMCGNYHLSLNLSSGINRASKAHFSKWVCVEPALTSIHLNLEKTHYAVGEEIRLQVRAEPQFTYSYLWNFDTGEEPLLIHGSGNVLRTYENPGLYRVTVTVSNNISTSNSSVLVEVQMPIGPIIILHNGTEYNYLRLREPYFFTTPLSSPDVNHTWNFGDGNIFTGQSVHYTYNISGNYNITLTAANSVSRNHTILPVSALSPIRNLTVNSSLINVPLNASVHFEAQFLEGDDVRFSWILCDHCTSIPGTHTMFYTFRSVGTFNIIVTAENHIGTAQANIFLYVQRELDGLQIVAKAEAKEGGETRVDGCCFATNRVLHLHADLKEGTNMTFNWNIINELQPINSRYNISAKTTEVSFSTPGPCLIILGAANLLGQLSTNRTIHFLEPVGRVSLQISNNPIAVNALTNLSVPISEGSDLQYRWFVNGDNMQWKEPWRTQTFPTPGLYLVTVEVFNEVSSKLMSERISVQERISGTDFIAIDAIEQSYIATGVPVTLHGKVDKGTNVTWTWTIDGTTEIGQSTTVVFLEPKTASITLNASNDISEQVVPKELFVQDKIQGLELRASKQIAVVGERVEFTILMAAGSNVELILSISGDATVSPQLNQTYVHVFSRVDTYMVNLTAHNQVSSKRRHLQVEVMEPVRGLSIHGIAAAIPVGVKRLFTASIKTGKPVGYLWTFDLHHLHKTSHFGQEQVSYIPEEAGLLTIYLRAFNALHGQNITEHILVQNLLKAAVLNATPQDTLVNKTVTLVASVTPKSNPLECFWDFNDGSTPVHTSTTNVGHVFQNPGNYIVQVNCSNLVSWVWGQVEVNISVLECEEPEVQVIQAPRLAIWRSQPTFVEATVDLKGCVIYGAQYLWQVVTTPSCDSSDHLPSQPLPQTEILLPVEVDVRRLQLSLPKMALATGNYTLVFSLSYEGVPVRKAACLQLSIMAERLVPIIEGGTHRVWSRTQDLQLSAEQSYDPNMDPDSQSLLHYHWECVSTSKGPEHCSSLNFGLGYSDPVLGISGSELEENVEYTFKLSISKDGMTPESTTQTVLVQSGHIPMVYLECVSCRAQSIYEISQNSYVYLRGTCTNCQGFHRGRWTAMTLQNETLILDSTSITTEKDCMDLVLRQGALRHGDSYIFTLHVTDDMLDGEGAASITLHHNMPPAGGVCHLRAGESGWDSADADVGSLTIRTLLDKVHFNCSGYSDRGISETPLLYSLLVTRCKEDYCEEFCVYKGSSPEHSAFLPPGFKSARHRVAVSITVEDLQGATITALNKSIEVVLPDPPPEYSSLPHWLSELTDSRLKQLLEQGDSQRVRELSLALITVLNEYEQSRESRRVFSAERVYRVRVRSNITRALTALDLNTVNDIQQTSAALAQCTAVSREFICEECQNSTLNKLESMLDILQNDTKQGTVTPTEIADNILNIMGDLIHQVSQSAFHFQPPFVDSPSVFSTSPLTPSGAYHGGIHLDPSPSSSEPHPLRVAAKAYSLSSVLMLILMHGRVLNEEPLVLRGTEIAATGKLADPQSLLCYHGNSSPECQQFSIPRAFNSSLGRAAAGNSVMQLLLRLESNPFPFNYVANYTVSTEVASMEFRTENGTQIPISGLDDNLAITVAINNGTSGELGTDSSGAGGVPPAGAVNISRCNSVIVRVITGNNNRQAGLFIQLNFTALEDAGGEIENDINSEEPYIEAYLHSHEHPSELNCTERKRITLSMTRSQDFDHRKYTFFLSPEKYDTTQDYFINVSTPCDTTYWSAGVHLEVGLFASLCQYFSESEKQWRTDGMVPLAETNSSRAVCRTRHLTAFAAGLFVPPHAVSFSVPMRSGPPSFVVLLVCVLGFLCYVVAAAILHKLDQLDLRRAGVVPLCGTDGLFKYEVQVKTGWTRGAGTTAHVGISLYGREGRTGHRHLDSKGAFTRNALDIFHIATDNSLGSVWKMRIWHDNKGLSPAWMLQYILVKDLQTGSSYYFLVDEWLSVDNEKTDGQLEIEVEASEEGSLRHFPRLLRCELQRALCESHLWLSLWEKPPRSPFTRLQRATCCALLLQLFLAFNTLWYSIVVDERISSQAIGQLSSLNGETLAAGVVTCLIAYPLYLLVFTLFRMSRSKCVSVEQVPPPGDQESVEIDYFLDNSIAGSSFLYFDGETNSEETNVDLPTPSTKSMESWGMAEEESDDRDWPELLGHVPVTGGAGHGAGMPRLKRGQGSRHLGVDMTFNPEDEDEQRHKYFTSSDEDLIKHILSDGQNFFPQADESEMADLSSILEDNTEVILLQKINDPLPLESVRREPPKTAFSSNTVVADVCRPRRFPPWCGRAALWGSWAAIALANSISIWAAHGFNQNVAMMWLISSFASFLCSCFLLEPIKVLCEAIYYAVFVCRLRPEDQDVLVEFPTVERVVQRVHRVRPPQGYALSQDRHQARKVRMLHTMLKNFLVYMFFLLVVLLLNYSDSAKETHSLRLHTQLQRVLHTPEYHNISSRHDVLAWLNRSLLPRLLNDSALLGHTGSVLLGTMRLRQINYMQGDLWGQGWPNITASGAAVLLNNSTDLVLQLNRSLEEASISLQQRQQQHWLDERSRALFVEFSLYNINTKLLAVFSFLFEFPVSERAQSSLDLVVITLWPITGLDLQLLLTMVLLILVFYFLVRGILGCLREGYSYLLSTWRLLGICKLTIAASVCGLHLSRCVMAQQLWTLYLRHPRDAFTDFYPLAKRTQMYTVMAALLLFILVLKASHQLRFLREWAVFGRALRRSVWELLGVALALLLLLLAYSHTGHLLFHSVFDGYGSVSATCLSLLGASGRGLLSPDPSWTLTGPSGGVFSLVFHTSFAVLRLLLIWLVTSILLRNYRRGRAELYRPAVDLQDYEMVELFLRRLKMWMGLSRTKEFRHKVRFEGMELPPSRSSSTSDCKSLCLPPLDRPDSPSTPDSVDGGSEASWCPAPSSPCSLTEAPGVGPGLGIALGPGAPAGWRERAETEAALKRLLPTFDALLQQLDRVTISTEDVFHMECQLERAQRKRRRRGRARGGEKGQREKGARKDRKSSKNKNKVGKKVKKRETSELSTECRDSADPKATPAPKSKALPVRSPSSNTSVTAPPPTPITAPATPPVLPADTPFSHYQPPKLSTGPPRTPTGREHFPAEKEPLPSSSLFNHPAHTTTIPTHKRKRKPPPLKNKVHPN
ncbi:polycystin-1 isoform X1 [Corythoichthys intestinalis]|uniref:polycystin-1 isoform X1 n=2 Tax=Corythoichthys intestinalis TaxID=161448 RepID=UPI0025A5A769|nr:polycystin-1 isoform X1 [Corythoichthys intestinalis]